jgi:hypothetical protein
MNVKNKKNVSQKSRGKGSSRAPNKPLPPTPARVRNRDSDFERISGSEIVCEVQEGEWLPVSVNTIDFHRVGVEFRHQFDRFEKWFVRSLKFTFVPAVASTMPGTVAMKYDLDPVDPPPKSQIECSKARYSVLTPVSRKADLSVTNKRLSDGGWLIPSLYTDVTPPLRAFSAGQLWVNCTGSTGGHASVVGSVHMKYDIAFISRDYSFVTLNWGTPAPAQIRVDIGPVTDRTLGDTAEFDTVGNTVPNIQILDSTGAALPNDPGVIYKANIDLGNSTAALKDQSGHIVPDGQTVYFTRAWKIWDPVNIVTVLTGPSNLTSLIGEMATEPGFAKTTLLAITGIAGTFLTLKNVQGWWRSASVL